MGFNTWIPTWHSQRLGVNFMSSHAGKLKGTYFWGLVIQRVTHGFIEEKRPYSEVY